MRLSSQNGLEFRLQKMMETERLKLANMESVLKQRVIGQTRRSKLFLMQFADRELDLKIQNRPIGSFIFLGPTGVGKTELAKSLAENLFNSEKAIVRIDMSRVYGKTFCVKINRFASWLYWL